jgi:hypothetical protein
VEFLRYDIALREILGYFNFDPLDKLVLDEIRKEM